MSSKKCGKQENTRFSKKRRKLTAIQVSERIDGYLFQCVADIEPT